MKLNKKTRKTLKNVAIAGAAMAGTAAVVYKGLKDKKREKLEDNDFYQPMKIPVSTTPKQIPEWHNGAVHHGIHEKPGDSYNVDLRSGKRTQAR